jgi:hypothetical protein
LYNSASERPVTGVSPTDATSTGVSPTACRCGVFAGVMDRFRSAQRVAALLLGGGPAL